MYSKEELQNGLNTSIFGKKIFTYDTIDSTNSYAKTLANTGAEEGTVIIADYQTAGRGRLGRTWQAESGKSLLLSTIIRPKIEINKVGLLPFFAALGASQALEIITGRHFECKWPNDVLFNGKKCCGILLESSFQHNVLDYAIIGIGVNVNQEAFGDDIKDRATSLKQECGIVFDRIDIFHQIIKSLDILYSDVKLGNFTTTLNQWKTRTMIFGKQVIIVQSGERIYGRAINLTADGGLILATKDGERVCYAGDVVLTGQI